MAKVTDVHVRRLFQLLGQGQSLTRSACRAGIDRKTARRYRKMKRFPSEGAQQPRTWRTRPDPFATVWPEVAAQLTQAPGLQAQTLWDWLRQRYPGQFSNGQLRTLQRRIKDWRATQGPGREVFFRQEHHPGRLCASDFTHMSSLHVTIGGQPFDHMVYHWVLTYSNWEAVTLCFAESFESLSDGLQNALRELGGVPERHRSDRMSAAVNNLTERREFTARYQALLAHYGLVGEKINPRAAHENGDAESSHRHFKTAVDQALLLRGSRDFASREQYAAFVETVRRQRNAGRAQRLAEEQALLRPLPPQRLESCKRLDVTVTSGSVIHVQNNVYSVNSRLIGERVEVRIYLEHLDVWYGQKQVATLPRLHGRGKQHIDYRHVIDALVRKPGALANYCYRAELFPSSVFRMAYDSMVSQHAARADREYLELLHLAAHTSEAGVEQALRRLLDGDQPVTVAAVQTLVAAGQEAPALTAVTVAAPDLTSFETLLTEEWHEPEQGWEGTTVSVLEGTPSADDAGQLRGAGPAGGAGDVVVRALPAGTESARMREPAGAPDRPAAAAIPAGGGEGSAELRPEAAAGESGSASADAAGGFVPGAPRERVGLRPVGFGKDAFALGLVARTDPGGPQDVLLHVQPLGAGTAGGEARLEVGQDAEAAQCLRRSDHRRLGLCAAEPGGDGGAVHAAGGAVRTGQCAVDQQPAVLEVGDDLQGPTDDGRSHRPLGPSQHHPGIEHPQLPARTGQEGDGLVGHAVGIAIGWRRATGTGRPREPWGILIVAKGEG